MTRWLALIDRYAAARRRHRGAARAWAALSRCTHALLKRHVGRMRP